MSTTPTPWRIEQTEGAVFIWGADDSCVAEFEADIDTASDDADLIVRAVNSQNANSTK